MLARCRSSRLPSVQAEQPCPASRLETPRLLLRPVRPSDVEALYAFMGDPAAKRFDRCDAFLRACRGRLAAFEWQRRRRGHAPWAAVRKADGRLLGWGGVYVDPFDPCHVPKLGYSFHPSAWGIGLATELAHACLDWADAALRLPEVRAYTHPDNGASRRVLEEVGFVPVGFLPDRNRVAYRRDLGAWPAT